MQPENFRENIYDNEKDPVASLTLEQVDGETTLHPRRRALPPTPSCSDDEYVEMRPHSVSSCMSVSVLPVNVEYERNSQLQLHQQLSSNSEYVERLPTDEGVNETEVDLKNWTLGSGGENRQIYWPTCIAWPWWSDCIMTTYISHYCFLVNCLVS